MRGADTAVRALAGVLLCAIAHARTGGPPWFEDVAAEVGIDFTHDSGHRGRFLYPESVCGGCAVLDADGDGFLEVYFVQSGAILAPRAERPPNRLFRNRGDGTFVDATAGSGADDRGWGMSAAAGDYDNDGVTDLYVCNLDRNTLLRGRGDGTFEDVTDAAGVGGDLWSSAAAFVDIDGDGDLDLFVVNYIHWSASREIDCLSDSGAPDYCSPRNYQAPTHDTLYRNNGDGTFTDASAPLGLRAAGGNGLGVLAADLTGDGKLEIFVANDGTPNHLWAWRGGSLREVAMALGCAVDMHGEPKAGMGVDAVDVDDDGDLDLLVVNLAGETDSLYRNEGGFFVDDTALVGLAGPSRSFTRFGVAWVDFDHDGLLDLYEANGKVMKQGVRHADDPYAEPNLLLRGVGGGSVREVRAGEGRVRGGTERALVHASRAAAFGDLDNDGDVDVVVVNRDGPAYVLRNIAPKAGHAVTLRVLDEHGRDALGAEVVAGVKAEGGERRLTRVVKAAYSYGASNDPRVHLGLGAAERLEWVEVRWVDGARGRFGPLDAGREHVLSPAPP